MEAIGSGTGRGFKRTYEFIEKLLIMQLIKIWKGIKEENSDTKLCRISLREQKRHCQSVQTLSYVRLFGTPWTVACQASQSITNSQILLKLMSIESMMPSKPPSPPALYLSQHQGLHKWVSSSHQVAKVLEFQLHQSFQWIFMVDFL